MRDFRVRTNTEVHEHDTGRLCDDPKCRGNLYDSIINFGEGLDQDILHKGSEMGMISDIIICMGTSMRVEPACSIPLTTKMLGGKLVICNLQKTIRNDMADLCIYAKCDDIMKLLMKKLNLEIPPFKVQKWMKVDIEELKNGKEKLNVRGIDRDGGPYELFNSVKINGSVKNSSVLDKNSGDNVVINLAFEGHYNE